MLEHVLKISVSLFLTVMYFIPHQSCSLSTLQARLKVAAHQAEEESEETAENFLEGRTDIDEFLTSFMEKRTVRSHKSSICVLSFWVWM